MWLDGNPKSSAQDFTLTLTPEETDDGTGFVIKVREGAPGELTAQASLEGGTLSSSTVTIAQGTDEAMLSFTQTAIEVTLTLSSPTALPGPDPADSETGYKGLRIAVGGPLTPMGICDRTPAVQEGLLEKIAGVTDCRAVTISHLEGVSGTLDLSHPSAVTTALTALKDWDFRDLSGLEGLDLSGNAITSMSDDLFMDLDSLVELDVSRNGLTVLPAVNGLTELTSLDVSGNALSGLPSMSTLTKVTNLDGSGNDLTVFPDLTGLTGLTRLDLSGNEIGGDLPSSAFSGLSGLEIIRLDDNELTGLEEGVFVGLESLTTVWLDGNPKSSSAQDFILILRSEATDDGTGFVIKVREGAPGDLTAQADLEGGTPTSQTVRIVKGTSETLLAFTQTASTATLTLRSPSSLPGPDPANSETGYKGLIVAVVSAAASTQGICDRTLEVQQALLEKIVEATDCQAVTVSHLEGISGTLDLSSPSVLTTALTGLKEQDLKDLRGLEGLNLSGNSISSLSSDAFSDLESLTELDVSGNGLTGLPLVNGLTNLTSLKAFGNALPYLPAVNGLTNLTYFDVSGNELTGLPDVSALAKVTDFDVSANSLVGLPDVTGLEALTNLDASGNALSVFPDLTGLTALTRLDLSGNGIEEVPSDAFSGLSGLEIIRLDDNELTSLPQGVFVGLDSLTTLWLDGNPKSSAQDFTLTLTPEETDDGTGFVIKVREGAPAELTAQASLEGGTLSSSTVTIAQGTDETMLSFTQTAIEVTLTLSSPTALPGPDPADSETGYKGLVIAVGGPLTPMGICDRTPAVQEGLLEKIAGVTDCRAVTISHLEGVSGTLDLSHPSAVTTALTALKDWDFRDLRGLEGLDLSGNSITSMSDALFTDFESLAELDVSGNGLTGLPAVNGLTGLTSLDISANALSVLPAVNGLTELTFLDVSGNALSGLPDISTLTKVTNLDASGNDLTVFPDLTGLTSLTRLDLSGNEIVELSRDAFDGLSELEIIRLDDNELTSLVEGVFVGLESLTTVWLDGNPKSSSPQDFTLTLTPEATDDGTGFVIKVREGAPGELTAQASLEGGTPSSATVTIAQGTSETLFTFTPTASTVTLTLSEPSALPEPNPTDSETGYKGLVVAVVSASVTSTPETSTQRFCDRTPEVQEALLAKIVGVTDCRAVTVSHLEGVSGTLDLSHPLAVTTALTELKEQDFKDLRGLEILNLSGNSIESLSAEAFSDLDSLTELDVSRNSLESLPSVNGLTELTTLKASGNALPYLPAVNRLINLTYFDVSRNQLTGLPAVSALAKVTRFDVSENALVGLPDVTGLAALTNLDASGNALSVFPDLTGLTSLRRLDLSGNGIEALPSDGFSGLSGLEIIRLDDNELTSLPQGIFVGLEGLTTLWLDGNPKSSSAQDFVLTLTPEETEEGTGFVIKVREGAPGELTAQASLEGGTLSSSTVTIAQGTDETMLSFTQTATEVTLTLSSPSALAGPDPIGSETGYKGLRIAVGGPVTPLGICGRTLAVQEALLEKIAGVTDCRAVTVSLLEGVSGTLDLSHPSVVTTALTGLKDWDFRDLSGLEGLDLSENAITSMSDDLFMDLDSLVELDVSGNGLTDLPRISGLTSLTSLDVSANALSGLPSLTELTELTSLDVSANALSGLPDTSTLTKLMNLDVSGNGLSVFPSLAGLSGLRRLDLSGNGIGELPSDAFSGLSGLEIIRLDDNELTGLEEGVFVGLESLTTVWLDGNPKSLSPQDFTLTLTPEVTEDGTGFVIKVREGAPVELTAQASLEGGTPSSATVTIAQGMSETLLSFTQTASTVTLTLSEPTVLPGPDPTNSETGYKGLVIAVVDTPLIYFNPIDERGICPRTPQVQNAILNALPDIDRCENVMEDDLAKITGPLIITSFPELTELRAGDFDGLSSLQRLDLSDNQLTELPQDIFSALLALTILDLSDNQLTELPDEIFSALLALTTLDLSDNQLTALPQDVFSVLLALTTLDLSDNRLTELPQDVFSTLLALTTLDLSDNRLTELAEDVFSALPRLDNPRFVR